MHGYVATTGSAKTFDPFPGVRYIYPSYAQFVQTWPSDERQYLDPVTCSLTYELNNFGFRGKDFVVERSDRIRIAVLGDSFAFGMGVRNEDLFTELVERELNTDSSRGVEVYNFALPGIGTEHERALYEHVVCYFNPDIVIVWYVLNDVNGPSTNFVNWSHDDHLPSLRKHWLFLDFALGTFERILSHRNTLREINRAHVLGHPGFQSVSTGLEGIAETASSDGTLTYLFVHPWLHRNRDGTYPFANAHDAVIALAEEKGFHCTDLTPCFVGSDVDSLLVHSMDHHPNETAHKLVAEVVQDVLWESIRTLDRQGPPQSIPKMDSNDLASRVEPGFEWYLYFPQ